MFVKLNVWQLVLHYNCDKELLEKDVFFCFETLIPGFHQHRGRFAV